MNVAFSQRLSEIPTDSASMSEPPTTALTQSMPVEEIVLQIETEVHGAPV